MADEEVVVPGQRVAHVDEGYPGPGTYVRKEHIYSSVVGFLTLLLPAEDGMTARGGVGAGVCVYKPLSWSSME